uniref:Uncharacterized protein n=1 Tax=Physcomitrium patens TaxID=3218 RepID=A0A2K1JCS5_PHYPA|nr:hypothetical protein PHYPA_019613 [Physcomitrium patens]
MITIPQLGRASLSTSFLDLRELSPAQICVLLAKGAMCGSKNARSSVYAIFCCGECHIHKTSAQSRTSRFKLYKQFSQV